MRSVKSTGLTVLCILGVFSTSLAVADPIVTGPTQGRQSLDSFTGQTWTHQADQPNARGGWTDSSYFLNRGEEAQQMALDAYKAGDDVKACRMIKQAKAYFVRAEMAQSRESTYQISGTNLSKGADALAEQFCAKTS